MPSRRPACCNKSWQLLPQRFYMSESCQRFSACNVVDLEPSCHLAAVLTLGQCNLDAYVLSQPPHPRHTHTHTHTHTTQRARRRSGAARCAGLAAQGQVTKPQLFGQDGLCFAQYTCKTGGPRRINVYQKLGSRKHTIDDNGRLLQDRPDQWTRPGMQVRGEPQHEASCQQTWACLEI